MTNLPTHIITGFLGAGKTTFMLQLLEKKPAEENWAIVINEFGRIAIDSATLKTMGQKHTPIYEIAGGCICCSSRDDLGTQLKQIVQESTFDRILIEPSGLGGVDEVETLVNGQDRLKLMPSVCLVDMTTIGNYRLQINPLYKRQIHFSDKIVFSKTDLLDQDEIADQLAIFQTNFPDKTAHLNANKQLSLDDLMNLNSKKSDSQSNKPGLFFPLNGHQPSTYHERSFSVPANQKVKLKRLIETIQNDESIIRAKGVLNTDSGWQLLNYTLSDYQLKPDSAQKNSELVVIFETNDLHHASATKFEKIMSQTE
ncbi:MAG TPA: GTP-binding protein [Sunxiuqinia sp.]|nr:GTP-binding protein [Sunxiuqinia sp.]